MIATRIGLCILAAVAVPSTTWGFVEAKIPLERLAVDSQVVVAGTVKKLNTEQMTAVLSVETTIKGDLQIARFNLKLRGNETREHGVSSLDMAERLEQNAPFVAFVTHQPGSELIFLYCRGTWYRLSGTLSEDTVRGRFENSEPFLRRTFHGDTAELQELLRNHVTSNAPLPDVDSTVEVGLGPRIGEQISAIIPAALPNEAVQPAGQDQFEYFEKTGEAAPPAKGALRYVLLVVGLAAVVAMLVWSLPERTTPDA